MTIGTRPGLPFGGPADGEVVDVADRIIRWRLSFRMPPDEAYKTMGWRSRGLHLVVSSKGRRDDTNRAEDKKSDPDLPVWLRTATDRIGRSIFIARRPSIEGLSQPASTALAREPLPPGQVWGKKFVIYAAMGVQHVDPAKW